MQSDWVPSGRAGRWRLNTGPQPKTPKRRNPIPGAHDISHVSSSLPRGCPGADGYDKEGRPIINSMRTIRNIEAMTGYVYDRRNTSRSYGWDITADFPERED